ncbi:LytR/AlgR family response regulator transcription factor [Flavobacterium sp. 3HN19-14]|uniref:LytR/AlgR family response regulator transcription factor n=1 Tax=Flavobacterium sp. 3HN19-14 TaxID=3448133 RepID=UPI003EDFC14D
MIIKDAIFIKDKFKYTKLLTSDILWIKSEGNYLEIHNIRSTEFIRGSLSNFMERLSGANFFRTHKSYIVNLDYLVKLETNTVTIAADRIPITRSYADELIKRLNIL